MRKILMVFLLMISGLLVYGCGEPGVMGNAVKYEDGSYRGVFIDQDSIQINVEFRLKDGVVTEASFRHLRRDDNYNLEAEAQPYRSVVQQYKEALEHLTGKNIEAHLNDLYTPERIVTTQVDGYTSATIRSNKIISAVRDALNRGVYSY